jgi:hypothetical protein
MWLGEREEMIDDESFSDIPDRGIFADHEHLSARLVAPT